VRRLGVAATFAARAHLPARLVINSGGVATASMTSQSHYTLKYAFVNSSFSVKCQQTAEDEFLGRIACKQASRKSDQVEIKYDFNKMVDKPQSGYSLLNVIK